jgi:hypothetical protein
MYAQQKGTLMKPIHTLTGLGLLMLLLAGCQQDPNAARERSAQACADRGLTPGSTDFANCQMGLGKEESQRLDDAREMDQERKERQEFYKRTRLR